MITKLPEPTRSQLIDRLSFSLGAAMLRIDGHEVSFEVRYSKPLTYVIVPFINGHFRGGWLLDNPSKEIPDAALARRVLRPRVSQLYGPKKLKELNKMHRRAGLDQITKEQNEREYFDTWHCPKALVAHLEKEFDSIEVLEDGHE